MILVSFDSFGNITADEQKRFREFLDFCIETLLHKENNSKKQYRIHFRFDSELESLGEVEVEDDVSDRGRYKEYLILFNKKCRKRKLLTTLAHELTHVKQYARGELNFGSTLDFTYWNDKLYDERKLSYWLLPWEIEAYGLEKCLYEMWIDSIRSELNPKDWVLK